MKPNFKLKTPRSASVLDGSEVSLNVPAACSTQDAAEGYQCLPQDCLKIIIGHCYSVQFQLSENVISENKRKGDGFLSWSCNL